MDEKAACMAAFSLAALRLAHSSKTMPCTSWAVSAVSAVSVGAMEVATAGLRLR